MAENLLKIIKADSTYVKSVAINKNELLNSNLTIFTTISGGDNSMRINLKPLRFLAKKDLFRNEHRVCSYQEKNLYILPFGFPCGVY